MFDPSDAPPPAQRPRILVVEDDSGFRTLVSTWLDRAGYDVYTVGTSDEALAMLRFVEQGWPTDDLELVILDQYLPGGSGLELLRQVHARRAATRALLMTAFPDQRVLDEAGKYGAPVLLKPFSLDALSVATSQVLSCGR